MKKLDTSGMTMVEIVLAMLVASIVVSMAAVALMKGQQATVTARNQSEAANIMEFIVTRFQTARFESVLGAAGGGHLAYLQDGYPNPTVANSTTNWRNSVGYSGYPNNYYARWQTSPMKATLDEILKRVKLAGFTAFRVEVQTVRRDFSDYGESGDSAISDFTPFRDVSPSGAPDGTDDLDSRLRMWDCNGDGDLSDPDTCPGGISEMPATNLRQLTITLYKGTQVASRTTQLVSSEKLTGNAGPVSESTLRFQFQFPIGVAWIYQRTAATTPHLDASPVVAPFFRKHLIKSHLENYNYSGRLGSVMPVDFEPYTTAHSTSHSQPDSYHIAMVGTTRPHHDPLVEVRTEPGHYFEFNYNAQTGYILGGATMNATGFQRFLVDANPEIAPGVTLRQKLMEERQHTIWGRARHGDQTSPWSYRVIRTDATPPRARNIADETSTFPPHNAFIRTRTPRPWIVVVDTAAAPGQASSGLIPEIVSIATTTTLAPVAFGQINYLNHLSRTVTSNPVGGYPLALEIVMVDTGTHLPYVHGDGVINMRAEFGDLTHYKSSAPWSFRVCVPPSVDPLCPAPTSIADISTPTVTAIGPLAGSSYEPTLVPAIAFALADPESGVDPGSLQVWVDGNKIFDASDTTITAEPGKAYTFSPTVLPNPLDPSSGGFKVSIPYPPAYATPGLHTITVWVKNWGDNANWNEVGSVDANWTFTVFTP